MIHDHRDVNTKTAGRYLLFSMDTYYPAGGINDLIYSADTVEELIPLMMKDDRYGWQEIVDKETMLAVEIEQ